MSARWRERWPPHRVFGVLGLPALVTMALLTPPFMFGDEPMHFKRAYGISLGEFRPRFVDGFPGFIGPASINALVSLHFTDGAPVPLTLAKTVERLALPLDPAVTTFIRLRPDALYPALNYAPQAMAIAAGRAFGATPLVLLFLARLANVAATVALIYWALRLMPVGREAMLFVALLPMSQAMLASPSPDALTIAGGLLFTAALVRSFLDNDWSWRRLALIAASGLLLCVTRYVYLPLLGAGVVVALMGPEPWRRRAALVQLLVAMAAAAMVIEWVVSNGAVGSSQRAGTDSALHLRQTIADPLGFMTLALGSLFHQAKFLAQSTFGLLGWTNLYLYKWHYLLLAAALIACLVAAGRWPDRIGTAAAARLPPWFYVWLLALIAVVVLLIELGLYMIWTPVGARYVDGVVGRYFLPFLPLLLFIVLAIFRRFQPGGRIADWAYGFTVVALAGSSLATFAHMRTFWGLW